MPWTEGRRLGRRSPGSFRSASAGFENSWSDAAPPGKWPPQPHGGGHPPKITEEHERRLCGHLRAQPDATLEELRRACGIGASLKAVSQALQRLDRPRKKKGRRAAERDEPHVRAQRRGWKHEMADVAPQRWLFLDQTGVTTRMQRRYARAPSGDRVVGSVPERNDQATTLMAAVRLDGSLPALVYDGGTDVPAMLAFVESHLRPLLGPGTIVAMDRLAAHTSPPVIEAIRETGAEVSFLPPYSPDLNPIEQLGAKVKTLLRSAAARTQEILLPAIADALRAVTPTNIQHWFRHSGYRNTQR